MQYELNVSWSTERGRRSVSVSKFCTDVSELLDEVSALSVLLIVCGDFNCPDDASQVDSRLMDVMVSHGLTRVDQPTLQDGNTLNLLAHVEGSDIVSAVDVIDVGLSDHFLVLSEINARCLKSAVRWFSFRDFCSVDRQDFTVRLCVTDWIQTTASTASAVNSSPPYLMCWRHSSLIPSAVASSSADRSRMLLLLPTRHVGNLSGTGSGQWTGDVHKTVKWLFAIVA